MDRAREGARDGRHDNWYWVMALGFAALIITCGASLIEPEDPEPESEGLLRVWVSITSLRSEIFDIASWIGVMLLSVCTITMQVAPPNSTARTMAKSFSLAFITMLVTMFCAKLNEFVSLPVVCIAWAMVAVSIIDAWRDS